MESKPTNHSDQAKEAESDQKQTLNPQRSKQAKEGFKNKLEIVTGKCIYRLPRKPRLCYQEVNAHISELYCRFHLDQDPKAQTHQH